MKHDVAKLTKEVGTTLARLDEQLRKLEVAAGAEWLEVMRERRDLARAHDNVGPVRQTAMEERAFHLSRIEDKARQLRSNTELAGGHIAEHAKKLTP